MVATAEDEVTVVGSIDAVVALVAARRPEAAERIRAMAAELTRAR